MTNRSHGTSAANGTASDAISSAGFPLDIADATLFAVPSPSSWRSTMCEHGDTVECLVPVHAEDAFEGVLTWKVKPVDRCLSDIVVALNRADILTRSCCCGHGRDQGSIILHDGRTLVLETRCPRCGAINAADEPCQAVEEWSFYFKRQPNDRPQTRGGLTQYFNRDDWTLSRTCYHIFPEDRAWRGADFWKVTKFVGIEQPVLSPAEPTVFDRATVDAEDSSSDSSTLTAERG